MVHKLQIILERQIAILAIKPRSAPSLARTGAPGHERRFADVGGDIEAGGAGDGFFGVGGGGGARVVFFALGFGFEAGFAFFFGVGFALGGFEGVFGAVPGFAEGGVGWALGFGHGDVWSAVRML